MDPIKKRNRIPEKRKKVISMELKKEIIEKREQGLRVTEIANIYQRSTSTICTILRQKESIKLINPAKGVKIISKLRTPVHELMESLLIVWIREKERAEETLTDSKVCSKARSIFKDLIKRHSMPVLDDFKASQGWFHNFRKRSEITSVVKSADVAKSNSQAVEKFIHAFTQLVSSENYIPELVFNLDEIKSFWKKLPGDSDPLDVGSSVRNKLSILLCSNASGDFKLPPLLVCHAEHSNSQISSDECIVRFDSGSNINRNLFVEWINSVFGPQIIKYTEEKNLPKKVLLVIDNAPTHAPDIENDLHPAYNFIRIIYLLPGVTPILQPMSKGITTQFKKHFLKRSLRLKLAEKDSHSDPCFDISICKNLVQQSWSDVEKEILISSWNKLWPIIQKCELPHDEIGLSALCESLDLPGDEGSINKIIGSESEDLNTDELLDLHSELDLAESTMDSEDHIEESASALEIEKVLSKWEDIIKFVHKYHPDPTTSSFASNFFDTTCLSHFRTILDEKREQACSQIIKKEPI